MQNKHIHATKKNQNLRILGALSLLILLSIACNFSIPGLSNKSSEEVVLFHDEFSDPKSGWNRVITDDGELDYADGVYRILVNKTNTDIWAQPGYYFTDTKTEVETFKVRGDRNNRFGIICRFKPPANFYSFLISSDGYFGIGKVIDGKYTLLGSDALEPSEDIKQGAAFNALRADCIGDSLALYVNGIKLKEVHDDEFQSGDLGLLVGTYEFPGIEILFDNFIVYKP